MAQITAMNEDAIIAEEELSGPSRRCIACGKVFPKETLLRFAVSPDGALVPDIAGKLPGRGLWVSANPECLETAVRKGRFSQVARCSVAVPDHLVETVAALLRKRCLSLIGMAKRSGQLVAGFDKTHEWLEKRQPGLLLEASDGAEDGRARLRAMAPGVPVVSLFSSAELAAALGRQSAAVHGAVAKGPSADHILAECARLAPFCPASHSN